jgi:hypothetical protein
LVLVREARIAGDKEEPADAEEQGWDLVDHAVGERLVARVAAHIGERQDAIDGLSERSRPGLTRVEAGR